MIFPNNPAKAKSDLRAKKKKVTHLYCSVLSILMNRHHMDWYLVDILAVKDLKFKGWSLIFHKKTLFVMTLTEHLTKANFDLRSRKNASLTLEMHYLVHLDQTSPRKYNVSCPFTKTSE